MKKAIISLAISALLLISLPVTVFAHGHSENGKASQSYAVCAVENCNTVGYHKHNGTTYSGHFVGDGHNYHPICNVINCTETGSHEHNGTTCLPHNNADGHDYHGSSHRSGDHH